MEATTEISVFPLIQTQKGELKNPYQEQKEALGKRKFDTFIVFGQGPVKPVLLVQELNDEQKTQWEDFKKDPLHSTEPDFRVIESTEYISILDTIDKQDISDGEKQTLKAAKRQEWQQQGRFALNRWGRQNALAAGLGLYLGISDKLILSGGKTIPKWAKEGPQNLPESILATWPSEAELMKDIIVRRFGHLMFEKDNPIDKLETQFKEIAKNQLTYEEFIQQRYEAYVRDTLSQKIIIEDGSTNTLENFANTLNHMPEIRDKDKEIGFVAADFHLRRVAILAHLFTIQEAQGGEFGAQDLLRERAQKRQKETYQEMLKYMQDASGNSDLRERVKGEDRWERGLIDPKYLGYWIGYFADVENPTVIQGVLEALKDPQWVIQARIEFKGAGLDFDDFSGEDLTQLKQENASAYQKLIGGLRRFKGDLRTVPPPVPPA